MFWKKGLGIGLIFTGIYLIATARVLTGAVIGFGQENLLGLLGVLVLVVGVGVTLVVSEVDLERRVKQGPKIVPAPIFFKRVEERSEPSTLFIPDTSAIRCYKPDTLAAYFNSYGVARVIVPEKVLDEICTEKPLPGMKMTNAASYFQDLRDSVENNSVAEPEGFEEYRRSAREILERTEKPTLARQLSPFVKKAKLGNMRDIGLSEMMKIQRAAQRIREIIKQETGLEDPDAAKKMDIFDYLEKKLEYLRVGEGDVDVLAVSMYEADNGYRVIIGEKDLDLRQGVEILRVENPKIGNNLDIVEPYEVDYRVSTQSSKSLVERLKRNEFSYA